ncbi:hypothetical protein WJ542_20240 [Paraburkholderia sp. B3]|uniref:hypothetical protein n=1 Tax=Paraburkholderia sp. B3 TaxID=3134791 RepID=UPI003981E211
MNGVLFLFAQTLLWVQAGGSFAYDAAFANDPNVGGYPQGAVLVNAALTGFWISTVENNVTDPDATDGSAQGWASMSPDWNAASGPGAILNRPDLAKVATSGSYNDLKDTPPIPPGYTLPPATPTTLGGIIAGAGTTIADDGTLGVQGSAIVNLAGSANVVLDLTPLAQGAPEIVFNLAAASVDAALSITNPPPGRGAGGICADRNERRQFLHDVAFVDPLAAGRRAHAHGYRGETRYVRSVHPGRWCDV